MENSTTNSIPCSHCQKEVEVADIFCGHCGYPQNGTQEQQSKFYGQLAIKNARNEDAHDKVKSARNTLFVLSGIIAVFGFVQYLNHQDIVTLGIDFGISLIFLGLAFWTESKPLMAVLIGLLLYLTMIVINAIIEPISLFKGIIWKVIIISFLGKGLYSASSIKGDSNRV